MRSGAPDDPIDSLYDEHDEALRQLEVLGRTGRAIAAEGPDAERISALETAVGFLDDEIRTHNRWEEDHLFPRLERYTGPGGPCSVMRAEHQTLWDAYGALKPLVGKAREGTADAAALRRIGALSSAIEEMLGSHIEKENQILFPMARRMLSPADLEALRAGRVKV